MAPSEFRRFLDRSLAVLAVEVPESYRRIAQTLDSLPMCVVVDGEVSVVHFAHGRHVLAVGGSVAGELRTSSPAIVALIDGEIELLDALMSERLYLRGPVDVVVRFERALQAYLAGAVRAPTFPSLLNGYRSVAVETGRSCGGASDGVE